MLNSCLCWSGLSNAERSLFITFRKACFLQTALNIVTLLHAVTFNKYSSICTSVKYFIFFDSNVDRRSLDRSLFMT
ncbi:hypothetical protein T01_2552 [Trichinella spiralis]|uniref:Uncharacterized protein n=1 Tax=Trichinella spiralis TaxID=6334 RepID=A0A0V1BHI8_TRISP|nr:hypothetical protein T01_2552 [Trichinella spiralis]